jgi:glucose/arabinose dehydrogenase
LKHCTIALCGAALLATGASAAPPGVGGDPRVNPADFRVTTFASGLNFPTGMQQLDDGSLLVATSNPTGGSFFNSTGALLRLHDNNGDGVADAQSDLTPLTGLPFPGTITTIRQAGNLLFATHAGSRISVMRRGASDTDRYSLVGNIDFSFTADWWHTTYGQAVRPTPGQTGKYDLLFNVGSRGNDVPSTGNPTSTGLLSATYNPDSIYKVTVQDNGVDGGVSFTNLTQLATGLRNSVGMAFHPTSGDLYFAENGIDGPGDGNEPLSADELNTIAAANIGNGVLNFGFPNDYIKYRTGERVGSGGVQPLVAFQPIPNPTNGSESEGPNEIAFAPASFPAGLNNGVFVGFHGKGSAGLANEENPVVYYDLATGQYFHFISNDEPTIGHPDGLLSTVDSLFISDLTNGTFSTLGTGAIYQIQVVPEPVGAALVTLIGSALLARRRRR